MTIPPGTERDDIQKAYATDEQLALRQAIHELYSVPRTNFPEWVLTRMGWKGTERVLDLGSGQGLYFPEIRKRIPRGTLIAGDLSLGMMRKARKTYHNTKAINLNALQLPFGKKAFDVVLANHVLFHLPDVDQALSEIKRILRPTGVLVASTNSLFTMPELDQLMRRSLSLLGAKNVDAPSVVANFSLEDGAKILGRHFFAVARYDLPGAFVFGTAKPALDYVNSMRSLRESTLPKGVTWDDFINVLGDQFQRIVDHFGELVFTKLSGVMIATDAGGFINDYVNRIIIKRRK